MFKLSGTSILKSSMLLVKNDDLLYQIELDFAVCLDLVMDVLFTFCSSYLFEISCVNGLHQRDQYKY